MAGKFDKNEVELQSFKLRKYSSKLSVERQASRGAVLELEPTKLNAGEASNALATGRWYW
jgi:hypothetical protein